MKNESEDSVSIVQIQFQEAKENGGFEEKIQIIF
jgi:hypothetical protein